MTSTRTSFLANILAGTIGGFAAGALVGVIEILLLAAFTGEWWGSLETIGYAVAVYGLLCALLGALCGVGWGLWSAWRHRATPTWPRGFWPQQKRLSESVMAQRWKLPEARARAGAPRATTLSVPVGPQASAPEAWSRHSSPPDRWASTAPSAR